MAFLRDLINRFKPKPVVDVISRPEIARKIAASPRARATLPQARRSIQRAQRARVTPFKVARETAEIVSPITPRKVRVAGGAIISGAKKARRQQIQPFFAAQERVQLGQPIRKQDIASLTDIGFMGVTGGAKNLGRISKPLAEKSQSLFQIKTATPLGNLAQKIQKSLSQVPSKLEGKFQLKQTSSLPRVQEGDVAVNKIIGALEEAKPVRRQQEKLFSIERSKRAAKATAIGKQVPGEGGFRAQLGTLKGDLPKVDFEGLRSKLKQPDIDSLFNRVEGANMPVFEKITTKGALAKILEGQVPTKNEIKLLSEVFPPEFVKGVLSQRPAFTKFKEGVGEVLAIPRSLMSSVDLSAPLRQGVFLIGRQKQFAPAFKNMFKFFVSPKAYEQSLASIKARPTYRLMRDADLAIMETGPMVSLREERFMSNLAEKIPGMGTLVKASNRAYTGFLNQLRADVFDDILRAAKSNGADTPQMKDSLAKFVNAATGRGDLGALNKAAGPLSTALFSPRLLASRLNLLSPRFYAKLEPTVRKEALKSLITFTGAGLSVLALAKAAGADVGDDPRSADFGKIKIGNTRYDIWGGFQQPVKLMAQLIAGETVSSTTGLPRKLGEGFKGATRVDIIQRFLESKESPVVSFAIGLARGENFIGDEFQVPEETINRLTPMVLQDLFDLSQERGAQGMLMGIPAFFGVGSQTYGRKIPVLRATPGGEIQVKGESVPGIGQVISNKIFKPKKEAKVKIEAIVEDLRAGEISKESAKARIKQAVLEDVSALSRTPEMAEKLKPLFIQAEAKKLKSNVGSVVRDFTLTEKEKQRRIQILVDNFKKTVKEAVPDNKSIVGKKIVNKDTKVKTTTRENDGFPFPDFKSSVPGQKLRADLNISNLSNNMEKADIVFYMMPPSGQTIKVPQTVESLGKGEQTPYGLEVNIPKNAKTGDWTLWVTVNGKEVEGTRKTHRITEGESTNRYK